MSYAAHFNSNMFYVACQTFMGERVFVNDVVVHLFQSILKEGQEVWPFGVVAYVIVPDSVALLLTLDEDVPINELMDWVQRRYTYTYQELMGMPKPMIIWQYSYRFGLVRNVDDFARRLDEMHAAPIKQGLVERPEEWPYSSYEKWVEEQVYKLGWGWSIRRRAGKLN